MKYTRELAILVLLLSILLVIVSSWSFSTFIRLSRAKDRYSTNAMLESACQVSQTYINTGWWCGLITTVIAFILLVVCSWVIYSSF
jgi:hypothetical protein